MDDEFRALIRLILLKKLEPSRVTYLEIATLAERLVRALKAGLKMVWVWEEGNALLRLSELENPELYREHPWQKAARDLVELLGVPWGDNFVQIYTGMKASEVRVGDELYLHKGDSLFPWMRVVEVVSREDGKVGLVCKGVLQTAGRFKAFDMGLYKPADEMVGIRRTGVCQDPKELVS